MPVNVWHHTLRLGDIFHADDMSFDRKRDEIARRIRRASWFDEHDFTLDDAVAGIEGAEDVAEFDEYWAALYDWADMHRVWVETSTRAAVSR